MKAEDIKIGTHKVGLFTISIQKPVFQDAPVEKLNYFEVLVHQNDDAIEGVIYYVDLVKDERFAHFHYLQDFSKRLTDEDVVEFNSHVSSVFHRIGMPTFKLSRHSIVNLFEKCQSISKKLKKPRP